MTNKVGNSFAVAGGMSAPIVPVCPRVFILSDFRLLREGVVSLLAQQSAVQVIGSADMSASPSEIAQLAPNMLLLDISVPGALELSGPIRSALSGAKTVALGVVEDEDVVLACARAGISGFVAPGGSARDVVAAVHSAVRGELVCSPRTAGMLLSRVSKLAARPPAAPDTLTDREQEILHLMDEGMSNKEIALSLRIRNATVKNHVHNILSKLRVRSRIEATAHLRRGLVRGSESLVLPKVLNGHGPIAHERRQDLDQRI